MAKKEANGTKKRFKFKLSPRWIAAISVVLSLVLIIVTAVIVSSVTRNPAVKIFDAYISAAKKQNVKNLAETMFENGSTEYDKFISDYEKGKSEYSKFLSKSSSEELDRFLNGQDNSPEAGIMDLGLRLEWEKNFANNIKTYQAYVVYSDDYSIRLKVKITYKESYSSSNMPGRIGVSEIPADLELRFKRIGGKWLFDAEFRLLNGQVESKSWFAPYAGGGTEVKRIANGDTNFISAAVPGSTDPEEQKGGFCDLTAVDGYADITSIGSRAFMNCTNLRILVIPDGLVNIGAEAFKGCTALEVIRYKDGSTVTIEDEITVGEAAFYNCKELTAFQLSPINKIIPNYVFFNCAMLEGPEKIIVEDDTTTAENELRTIKSEYPLAGSTTAVGYYAFYGCEKLTHIPLPASVKTIGDGAFENCAALTAIEPYRLNQQGLLAESENVLSENITRIGPNAFKNTGLKKAKLPDNILEIPVGLFNGCENLTETALPANIRSIGAYAFAKTGLNNVTFPASLEKIGNYAFSESNIGEITWKEKSSGGTSIRTLGEFSFYSCESLVSVTLPETVKGLGKSAFIDCSSLRSVRIDFPADAVIPPVGTDKGEIFSMSSGIPKIYVKNDLDGFKRNWYSMRLEIYSQDIIKNGFATMNESRTDASGNTINEKVLVQYLGTEELPEVPSDITRIGEGAFSFSKQLLGISNFASLNLTDIGRDVFTGCDKMAFQVYGNTNVGKLKYLDKWLIDGSAIYKILDLTDRNRYLGTGSTQLPDTIGIAAGAFEATDLVRVKFNKQLKYICDSAFPRLLELVAVDFEGESQLERIGSDAFATTAITRIELPDSLIEIDARAFFGCDQLRYIIINSIAPVKLGGDAAITEDGKVVFQQGEDMFFVGYDVLKLYIKNYDTTNYYKDDINWQVYKDVAYDLEVVHNSAAGKYAISKDEKTLIQLLETNQIDIDLNLTLFTIPGTVEKIGVGAFAKSTVEKVIIHDEVKRIEQYAFYECKLLASVTFKAASSGGVLSDSLSYIGTHAFRDTESLSGGGEIVFEATTPNKWVYGIDPFDSSVYRRIFVGDRDKYETHEYWLANRTMLAAANDPSLTVEIVIVVGESHQVVDITNHKNIIIPGVETMPMKKAPGESQEIEAKDNVADGYSFVGWYLNDELITTNDTTIVVFEKNVHKVYTAKFARNSARVQIVVNNPTDIGDIFYETSNDSGLVETKLSGGSLKGEFLAECNKSIKLEAVPYREYEFVGWLVNNEDKGNAPILNYTLGHLDVVIEAKFEKARAWVDLTQQTGGTVAIENVYNSIGGIITNYINKEESANRIRILLSEGDYVIFTITEINNVYEFDKWYIGNMPQSNSEIKITMSSSLSDIQTRVEFVKKKVEAEFKFGTMDGANFVEDYNCGVVYEGSVKYEGGSFSTDIPHGSTQRFAAQANSGYTFVKWVVTINGVPKEEYTTEILEITITSLDKVDVTVIFKEAEPPVVEG